MQRVKNNGHKSKILMIEPDEKVENKQDIQRWEYPPGVIVNLFDIVQGVEAVSSFLSLPC